MFPFKPQTHNSTGVQEKILKSCLLKYPCQDLRVGVTYAKNLDAIDFVCISPSLLPACVHLLLSYSPQNLQNVQRNDCTSPTCIIRPPHKHYHFIPRPNPQTPTLVVAM